MDNSVSYELPFVKMGLKIISTNDPEYLYDEHALDCDIDEIESTTCRAPVMHGDKEVYYAICIFNTDHDPTVGKIAKEAHRAAKIVFMTIEESEDAWRMMGLIIEHIADKIDAFLYPQV